MGVTQKEIDEFLAYLETPRSNRSRAYNRTTKSNEVRGRIGRLPQAPNVRVTPRGKAQTSYWRAQRVAEESLVVRKDSSIVRKFDEDRAKRIHEEVTGRAYKVKPGAAEEEKRLDRLQKILGSFVKDGEYI